MKESFWLWSGMFGVVLRLLLHRENHLLQIPIARGTPHHDLKLAWLDDAFHVDVEKRQRFRRDIERDGFGFARPQRNSLEAFQFLHGARDGADPIPDVHLHDLRSLPLAAVRDVHQHARRTVVIDRKSTRLNSSHLVISYAV